MSNLKNIKELGLELVEVGDNTYLIKGSMEGFEVFDLKHLIKEVQWEVIASVKPVEGLPLLVIDDEMEMSAEKYSTRFQLYGGETNKVLKEASILSYLKGYNKSKETYKFTEEDLKKAITASWMMGQRESNNLTDCMDLIIKSLSQKELHIDAKKIYYPANFSNEYRPPYQPKVENNQIKGVWK